MDEENPEYEDWLVLANVPDFGLAKWHKLLSRYTCQQARCLSAKELSDIGFSHQQINAIKQPDQQKLDVVRRWLAADQQHSIITWDSPLYPSPLKEIAAPPLILYGFGNTNILDRLQLAVVGSRQPSEYGRRQAIAFADYLAANNWVITSGLALGIDGAAHRGALNAGGQTLAVLGSGIDVIYPRRHRQLAVDIVSNGGLILSEYPPGMPPSAHHFPRRNRIISGLVKGVIVVEAAIKSGSLITARLALEQNREVFAIPGNILNPLSQGGHFLIRQGAVLVQHPQEVIDEFVTVSSIVVEEKNSDRQKNKENILATDSLLDSVDYEVTSVDDVAQRSQLDIHVVTARLLEYELRGLVTAVPGGYIKLRG